MCVNGVERARNSRGYSLVALDPTGRVLGAETFDTFLDPRAAGHLATWVDAFPAGTIVAGGVKDEAAGRLDGAAIRAVQTLGVLTDLRTRFRHSHAFVGVKGAGPGTALEGVGPRRLALAWATATPKNIAASDWQGSS